MNSKNKGFYNPNKDVLLHYDYYVIYYSCKEFGYSSYTERSDCPKWNKRNRSKIISLKYLGKIAKAVEALQRKDMRSCNNSNLSGELKIYKDTLEYLSSRADKISWELVNDKKYN